MKTIGSVKRGDSFNFTAALTDSATGDPLTGAATKLKCQGRYDLSGDVLVEMDISETAVGGTYLFAADSTADWIPESRILFDIQYTSTEGAVSSTETFYVTVEEDVTRDE